MLSQTLTSRARRLLLLPQSRSAHRGLSSHAPSGAERRRRRHHRYEDEDEEEEERKAATVKVTVWWDFQACRLPPGAASASRLGTRVTAALRGAGIRGPVVGINAFGDVSLLHRDDQEALAATGVTFSHVPSSGKKSSCDRSFMADLIYWIAQNPPPAHFFLISGDEEFTNILHRLRMSNYNVLLACPEDGGSKTTLHSAATITWPWEDLVRGGAELTPKHVNQPPDGSSGSWYGEYPVDTQLLKPEESHAALPWNTWVPRVPKSVLNGIERVLRFYPEGINLPDLRAQLEKANVSMDRKFYGYKKFSALLQAMPHVVKFIAPLPGGTQLAVVGVFKRSMESSEQDFDGVDSTRSSIQEKQLSKTECEDLSSLVPQDSSSELSLCAQKASLEADATSSPSDQLSSDQRKLPDLTTKAEPHSNHVEADVPLATDAPSPDALSSRDHRNVQVVDLVTQKEPRISHTRTGAEKEKDAAGAPTSTVQGSNIGKKGLLGRILSLWNGPAH